MAHLACQSGFRLRGGPWWRLAAYCAQAADVAAFAMACSQTYSLVSALTAHLPRRHSALALLVSWLRRISGC